MARFQPNAIADLAKDIARNELNKQHAGSSQLAGQFEFIYAVRFQTFSTKNPD